MKQSLILELADEAFYAGDISADGLHAASDEFCIKFAELIIFHCATVIVAGGKWEGGVVLDKLKEHFEINK